MGRYALTFGALSGLFGVLQVVVSVSAALESQGAIQSLYYGAQGGGLNPSIMAQWLGPLLTATYGSCLLGFAISMWLCWAAGRVAASAYGRRSAGTLAGLLTSAIGSAIWILASVLAVLLVHTDGSITGILNTSPNLSAGMVGGEVAGLVIQEVVAAAVALGFGSLAGRIGAASASLPQWPVRALPTLPPAPPFVMYPPALPPGTPALGPGPQPTSFPVSPVYPPPPEIYRTPASPNGAATPRPMPATPWGNAYPPPGAYPAYPAYPPPGAAFPVYPPAAWYPPHPGGRPAGDPRAQGLANYPGMPAAQPGGEQDAGTSQDEPPTPAE